MGETNFRAALELAKAVVRGQSLSSGATRIALVTYGDHATVQLTLGELRSEVDILRRFDAVAYAGGGRFLADALVRMRDDVFDAGETRAGVARRCVVIVGGPSNIRPQRTLPEAEAARAAGVRLYAVAVAANGSEELRKITGTDVNTAVAADARGRRRAAAAVTRWTCRRVKTAAARKHKRRRERRMARECDARTRAAHTHAHPHVYARSDAHIIITLASISISL